MHLPPHLNRQLEAWYICQWLQEGAPQLVFDLPNQGVWTADFSSMRAYETTAGQKFMCVQVKEAQSGCKVGIQTSGVETRPQRSA